MRANGRAPNQHGIDILSSQDFAKIVDRRAVFGRIFLIHSFTSLLAMRGYRVTNRNHLDLWNFGILINECISPALRLPVPIAAIVIRFADEGRD